jgi:hypothetical protein
LTRDRLKPTYSYFGIILFDNIFASAADFRFLCKKTVFYKYKTDFKIKNKTRHIIIPGLGVHVIARVTACSRPACTKEALPGSDGWRELTGRIGVNSDASEYLSTFDHNMFFTRLFIIKNAYKTSF